TSQVRSDLVNLDNAIPPESHALVTAAGASPLQAITRADGTRQVVGQAGGIAALGWTGAQVVARAVQAGPGLSVSADHLENALLRVAFDENGEITSILVEGDAQQ